MNDCLDDNEEVYSNESKEKYTDNKSHPSYSILSYPLGNHKIEKVVFTRLRLRTSIQVVLKKHNLQNLLTLKSTGLTLLKAHNFNHWAAKHPDQLL